MLRRRRRGCAGRGGADDILSLTDTGGVDGVVLGSLYFPLGVANGFKEDTCDVAAHPLGVVLVGGALRGALRLFLNPHGAGEGPRFPLVSEVGEVSGPHGVADTDAVAGLHARGLALLQVLGG